MKKRQDKKNRATHLRKNPWISGLIKELFFGGKEFKPLLKKKIWFGKPPKRRGVGYVYLVGLGARA